MMIRFDFLELITKQPQRFLLCTIQGLLSRTNIFSSFTHSGGVFPEIYPRQGKGHASIHFSYGFPCVIVTLRIHYQRWIWNPLAARDLKFRFFHVDLCFRHFDFWSLCEHQGSKRSWRELRHLNTRGRRLTKKSKRVDVEKKKKLMNNEDIDPTRQ